MGKGERARMVCPDAREGIGGENEERCFHEEAKRSALE